MVKSSPTTSINTVGQVVTYTFVATNTGNLTLSDVGVADTQIAPAAGLTTAPTCQARTSPAASCSGASTTLAPAQSATFTATYTVTQADLDGGSLSDSSTASGTPPTGPAVTSTPSSVTIPASTTTALTVAKSSTTAAVGTVVSS